MEHTALIKPLKMGNLTVDFPVMLAPMAGYTDLVMRLLARRHGCGMAFTEVVSADGIARGSKLSLDIIETAPDERPVAAHIYGANPQSLAQAAAIIERTGRFQAIDLNCGCPVARIMAKGAGAALMKHPEKIAQIIAAMKQAVTLPITAKTRIEISPGKTNITEIAHAVEESGGSALAIHARPIAGKHTGRTDWDALARIKAERSIPIIGNGGINSAGDALKMFSETGVDGVMIGKAAVGNPWIFQEVRALLRGEDVRPHTISEHRAMITEHLSLLIEQEGKTRKTRKNPPLSAEEKAVLNFRGHLLGYVRGFKNSAEIRRKLQEMRKMTDVQAAVDSLREISFTLDYEGKIVNFRTSPFPEKNSPQSVEKKCMTVLHQKSGRCRLT